ncbi:MAG: YfiR family protein [Methylosarcina sp.]
MKKNLLIRTALMLFFPVILGVAYRSEAADFAKEYVVKAAISLNLARFTEWPGSALKADSPNINLCVFGNKNIQQVFAQMENKSLGKRFLHVIQMNRSLHLEQCNMIYVSELEEINVVQLFSLIAGQPILSIGEQDSFLEQGGLVNLQMKEGKINIQVNLEALTRSGIKISSRVLALTSIMRVKSTGNNQ